MKKEDLILDFINDKKHYLRKNHQGKGELIAKALGLGKNVKFVLDLTCGLAEDSIFLCQLGFEVTAVERNKEIFNALEKALSQAQAQGFFKELKIMFAESKDILEYFFKDKDKSKWGIYLDPMFPEKKKSALPRKEMQLFREIVGSDNDAEELLKKAMSAHVARVVVKRPLKAPDLFKKPIHSFRGKTVRYDLY